MIPPSTLAAFVLWAYTLLLVGDALDAYNLGRVPVGWIAQVGFLVAAAVLIGSTGRLRRISGTWVLFAFCVWAFWVTAVNALLHDYADAMPVLTTSSYPLFVSLRFVTLLSFAAAAYIVYWLLAEGCWDPLARRTVIIGALVALAALYVYLAEAHGLPEPVRNRLGTAGGEQPTVFTYAFHRALGTFREPSLLAQWLVVPFFLGLALRGRLFLFCTVIIGATILLTGSLTGILGSLIGIGGTLLLTNPLSAANRKVLRRLLVTGGLSAVVFTVVAVAGYGPKQLSLLWVLLSVIGERTAGIAASNRHYVYAFVGSVPPPALGLGLGNANLVLSHWLRSPLEVSFLSLYLNVLYSTGVPGLTLLAIFLLRPLLRVARSRALRAAGETFVIVAGYFAWLAMFAELSEEFTVMFAVAFACLAYRIRDSQTAAMLPRRPTSTASREAVEGARLA